MKRCLFHIPLKIDPQYMSGSHIRPVKMMQAFRDIGYEVDVIEGTAAERKAKIRAVERRLKEGVTYDFLYCENSNMPVWLTEAHHFPTHPFLDFRFFRTIHEAGIPIGLYYRDIHWVYPAYRKNVPGLKGELAIRCFRYDLAQYNKYVDILYLQTLAMESKFPVPLKMEIKTLPPGADAGIPFVEAPTDPLHIFYVGGLGGHYEMEALFEAVRDVPGVKMTVCTRESDWKNFEHVYGKYVSDRIRIIHKRYDELLPYFAEASILARYFISMNSDDYNDFCISIKVFEYLGNQKPILTIENTAVADFVDRHDIGWSIPYDAEALKELLRHLQQHPEEIRAKQANMPALLEAHTWQARARQVAEELISVERTKHTVGGDR